LPRKTTSMATTIEMLKNPRRNSSTGFFVFRPMLVSRFCKKLPYGQSEFKCSVRVLIYRRFPGNFPNPVLLCESKYRQLGQMFAFGFCFMAGIKFRNLARRKIASNQ
jgi:hypothetical protein